MKKFIYLSLFILPALFSSCSQEEKVYEPIYSDMNYSFSWKNYEADATNETEWCMSRSNRWVAFTEYDKKTQFMLNWEGGMSDGDKENATVSITHLGNAPLVYKVAYINLVKEGEDCTINFLTADGSEGIVHFPL